MKVKIKEKEIATTKKVKRIRIELKQGEVKKLAELLGVLYLELIASFGIKASYNEFYCELYDELVDKIEEAYNESNS